MKTWSELDEIIRIAMEKHFGLTEAKWEELPEKQKCAIHGFLSASAHFHDCGGKKAKGKTLDDTGIQMYNLGLNGTPVPADYHPTSMQPNKQAVSFLVGRRKPKGSKKWMTETISFVPDEHTAQRLDHLAMKAGRKKGTQTNIARKETRKAKFLKTLEEVKSEGPGAIEGQVNLACERLRSQGAKISHGTAFRYLKSART